MVGDLLRVDSDTCTFCIKRESRPTDTAYNQKPYLLSAKLLSKHPLVHQFIKLSNSETTGEKRREGLARREGRHKSRVEDAAEEKSAMRTKIERWRKREGRRYHGEGTEREGKDICG